MPRLDRSSRWCVALWRHTSGLLVVAFLSLLLSQPFHERVASGAEGGAPAVVAGEAGADGATPLRAAGHDRDHCVQCRAVAQTRLGLRAPSHEGALALHGAALALHVEARDHPYAAPEPCLAGPRAPPVAVLLHS